MTNSPFPHSPSSPRPRFPLHFNNQGSAIPTSIKKLDLSVDNNLSSPHNEAHNFSPTFRFNHRGCLHLTPCSLSEYYDLPFCREDKYEFIDGFLICREMPGCEHEKIKKYCCSRMEGQSEYVLNDIEELDVYPETSIEIPSQDGNTLENVVVADVAARIRPEGCSPGARKAMYPLERSPPDVVIEIVSPGNRNRVKDVRRNVDFYGRRKIRSYVIVD